MIVAIAAMVILWASVVLLRHEIRARWWGMRLEQSTTATERLHYLQLLAGMGDHALPAARHLLRSDDVGDRTAAVALLNCMHGNPAATLLIDACADADETVRGNAIVGLSMHRSPDVVPQMRRLAEHPDLDTAMLATSRLVATDSPVALQVLCMLASAAERPGVRAQAIESLAEWSDDAVVDTLIACLADEAVFGGQTASQRAALEALRQAAPDLADAAPLNEPAMTNAWRAARALHAVTGASFGADADLPVTSADVWQAWRKRHANREQTEPARREPPTE